MAIDYVIYISVSVLSGLLSYYLTNNLIFMLITLLFFIGYFLAFEILVKRKERSKYKRHNDLTIFIHDFFLNYETTNNIELAIKSGCEQASPRLKEEVRLLNEFNGVEKLNNLANYFSSPLYLLFLKTVELMNKSGDSVKTASFLLEENNRSIVNFKMIHKNIYQSLCEFTLLWIVAFLILILLRFGINNYFAKLSVSWFYLLGIGLFFVFFLLSIYLFNRVSHRSVKSYE